MANLQIPNLDGADAKLAEAMFEFVQFLLDDDANLTPTGNLTSDAKKKLRDRMGELIAAEDTSTANLAPGEPPGAEAPDATPAATPEVAP